MIRQLTPCDGLGEVQVPCDGCTACCRNGKVWLRPADDPALYEVVRDGGLRLARKANGDCIYLDRESGCTIYADRPIICREFDCRRVVLALQQFSRKQRRSSSASREVQAAGRKRLRARAD